MTTQPLTPRNPAIVVVAVNTVVLAERLQHYGIPTDSGNVEPTLAVQRISTAAELITFINTVPDPTLPWCVIPHGWPERFDYSYLINNMRSYFGQEETMSSCIDMLNNEYAIDPKKLT